VHAEAVGGSVQVHAERPALERALGNLVRNARRHGPPGGRITVTTARDGDRACITVADEGPGLSPAEAARAFERFWRAPDARHDGSGIGLAIVAHLAATSGGTPALQRRPGGGLHASITLPRG
jgi:signal transduction histidine kinase